MLQEPHIYGFKEVSDQIKLPFNFADDYFFINGHIFRHLKLEFALAIPASNE